MAAGTIGIICNVRLTQSAELLAGLANVNQEIRQKVVNRLSDIDLVSDI